MKLEQLLSFFVLFSLTFASCKNNSGSSNRADEKVSDKVKHVFIADATEILPTWSTENIIVNHVVGEADHLHPYNSVNATKTWIHQYTHCFLLRNDLINLSVIPDLVTSMPDTSTDMMRYTYTLRNDATWDDGTPITLEDVIFSLKAAKSPLTNNPNAKPYISQLRNIETDPTNPQKFTIVMKQVYIQNVIFLTDYPIIQRKFYDPDNVLANYTLEQFDDPDFLNKAGKDITDWSNKFNDVAKYGNDPAYMKGAGPYQVEEWSRGQSLILQKKQNHWMQKLKNPTPYECAYPEKIIFKVNQDENSTMLELRSQAIDVTTWITTATLLELQKDPEFNANFNSRFIDTYSYNYLAMNTRPTGGRKPFFTDPKVRRAIAYLTPSDEVIQTIASGKGIRQTSMVSPLKPEYNSSLPLINYDVEAAMKLLDEAGWIDTDGDNIRDKMIDGVKVQFSFDYGYMTTQKVVADIAKIVTDAMYRAGVKANLKPYDSNLLYEETRQHNFDMTMGSWAGNSLPDDFTQIWHTSQWENNGSNFTGFGNAESDALIDSIKTTLDQTKRFEMIHRLQKMVYDEQPYVFMYQAMKRNVIHKRFGNQYMTFERPNVVLNYYKLLSLYGSSETGMQKQAPVN
ncbi:MAG: ABC transporter substrate-binding protein [Chitinophagales bacterium]